MENDENIRVNIRTGTSTRVPRLYGESLAFEEKTASSPLIGTIRIEIDHAPLTYETLLSLMRERDIYNISLLNDNELTRNPRIKLDIRSRQCRTADVHEECSICQNKFKLGEKLSSLNCHHIFHYNCLQEWGKYKQECPLCRTTIPVLER